MKTHIYIFYSKYYFKRMHIFLKKYWSYKLLFFDLKLENSLKLTWHTYHDSCSCLRPLNSAVYKASTVLWRARGARYFTNLYNIVYYFIMMCWYAWYQQLFYNMIRFWNSMLVNYNYSHPLVLIINNYDIISRKYLFSSKHEILQYMRICMPIMTTALL